MRKVCACNNSLSIPMVRSITLACPTVASVHLHPAMMAAYELAILGCTQVIAEELGAGFGAKELVDYLDAGPKKVAGLPVNLDSEAYIARIEFLNAAGEVVGMIDGLAVPMAFSADLERQQRLHAV